MVVVGHIDHTLKYMTRINIQIKLICTVPVNCQNVFHTYVHGVAGVPVHGVYVYMCVRVCNFLEMYECVTLFQNKNRRQILHMRTCL